MEDEERLQGLLAGCRSFLLRLTIIGSVLAVLLIQPLGEFWKMPRPSLTLMALAMVLVGLWSGFAIALCQGMAWFKRLALIGLAVAGTRLAFGLWVTGRWPTAEAAVSATAVASLVNLVVFFWWKDLFKSSPKISPWNREFVRYLVVAAAGVGGAYCFTQGDMPVAQRMVKAGEFTPEQLTAYTAANKLGVALVFMVGPILQVLFTSRSGHRGRVARAEQVKLLVMYAAVLAVGAAGMVVCRDLLVRLIFKVENPLAAGMIGRFAASMVFIALIQMLGMWALASRWSRLAILYGCCGVGYWLTLLLAGTSPDRLLQAMLIASSTSFIVLFGAWFLSYRQEVSAESETAG